MSDSARPNYGTEPDPLYYLSEWTFDLLPEFVYQFQGFCQYRTVAFDNAAKYVSPNNHADGDNDKNNGNDTTNDGNEGDVSANDSKMKKKTSSTPHYVTKSINDLSQNCDA